MTEENKYKVTVIKKSSKKHIDIYAHDSSHAQAQAEDITRATEAESYSLDYKTTKEIEPDNTISNLFKALAFNEFNYVECCLWETSMTNNVPCIYLFSKRYYTRNIILKYLDIPATNVIVKQRCKNTKCINPYHFDYKSGRNSKLSEGDGRLLLASLRQGASATQVAEVFKVHRSTIYRKLKDERFHSRLTGYC
jgi:hypothetical protein